MKSLLQDADQDKQRRGMTWDCNGSGGGGGARGCDTPAFTIPYIHRHSGTLIQAPRARIIISGSSLPPRVNKSHTGGVLRQGVAGQAHSAHGSPAHDRDSRQAAALCSPPSMPHRITSQFGLNGAVMSLLCMLQPCGREMVQISTRNVSYGSPPVVDSCGMHTEFN